MPSNQKSNLSIPGRPVIPFQSSSKRTQRQKIKIAISNSSMNSSEILYAAKIKWFCLAKEVLLTCLRKCKHLQVELEKLKLLGKQINKTRSGGNNLYLSIWDV
ncbi:Uncharacterized protein FWK35_00038395 [Aphis craccivora]|uniref:Uncharacterized protein n=1 Tax=Aphis craccivora TaxID=307492 RepID=A0A6G0VQM5_APHCR|nr:Uncharacterized protein FWK35_00038395 [Aphis craccivora]